MTRALASPDDFLDVPPAAPDHARKTNGIARDSATDARPAFVVRDGNYVSARWPGDAYTFARTFVDVLRTNILSRAEAPQRLEAHAVDLSKDGTPNG